MNQTFSWSRFGRLACTYFVDNRGTLLTNLALLTGLLTLADLLVYTNYPQMVDRNRDVPFYLLGWMAWYAFTWQQTEQLNQRRQAITYLMRPASQIEKILLVWFVSGILFLIVYAFLFAVADAVAVLFVNNRDWTAVDRRNIGSFQLQPFFSESGSFWRVHKLIWVCSALLHPFALTFLLLIRRYSFPLVAVLAFVWMGAGFLLNVFIIGQLTHGTPARIQTPFDGFYALSGPLYAANTQERRIDLPQPIGDQIRYTVGILVVVLLYVTAYFRLKEREV